MDRGNFFSQRFYEMFCEKQNFQFVAKVLKTIVSIFLISCRTKIRLFYTKIRYFKSDKKYLKIKIEIKQQKTIGNNYFLNGDYMKDMIFAYTSKTNFLFNRFFTTTPGILSSLRIL